MPCGREVVEFPVWAWVRTRATVATFGEAGINDQVIVDKRQKVPPIIYNLRTKVARWIQGTEGSWQFTETLANDR